MESEHPLRLLGPVLVTASFLAPNDLLAFAFTSARAWRILREHQPLIAAAAKLFPQSLDRCKFWEVFTRGGYQNSAWLLRKEATGISSVRYNNEGAAKIAAEGCDVSRWKRMTITHTAMNAQFGEKIKEQIMGDWITKQDEDVQFRRVSMRGFEVEPGKIVYLKTRGGRPIRERGKVVGRSVLARLGDHTPWIEMGVDREYYCVGCRDSGTLREEERWLWGDD